MGEMLKKLAEVASERDDWRALARSRAVDIAELEVVLREAVEFERAVMYHENPERDHIAGDGRTPKWYVNAVRILPGET